MRISSIPLARPTRRFTYTIHFEALRPCKICDSYDHSDGA